MAHVTIEGSELVVTIEGLDRILALKSELRIPMSHVKGATVDPPEAHHWYKGIKFGTNLPGVISAGTFWTSDGKLFYDMHDADRTVAIELEHDQYTRVIVEVDDPEAVARQIMAEAKG